MALTYLALSASALLAAGWPRTRGPREPRIAANTKGDWKTLALVFGLRLAPEEAALLAGALDHMGRLTRQRMRWRHAVTALAAALVPFAAVQPAQAQGGTLAVSGLDHAGVNVPDAGEAVAFFAELFGTHVVYDLHPQPVTSAWKARFRWHRSSTIRRIIMIATDNGSQIELFEYAAPHAARRQPHEDDPGATHLAFRTRDFDASLAALKRRGLTVLNEPLRLPDGSRWVYFLTPWGSQIELVGPA